MSTPKEIDSTATAVPDTTENYSVEKPMPIMAVVSLQKWSEHDDDYAEIVGCLEFDAAPVLAGIVPGLSPYQLSDLPPEICDQVFYEAVSRGLAPNYGGPFELDVQNSLNEALAENPAYFDIPYPHHLADRHPEVTLQSPLSPYEIGVRVDGDGIVGGLFSIGLSDLIENDLEGVNDRIGKDLVGSELLMEPAAIPVRVDDEGTLIVRLQGDASMIIDGFDGEELEAYEAGLARNPSGGPVEDPEDQS